MLNKIHSAHSVKISIHMRGVSECKISLIPLSGAKPYKLISEIPVVKKGAIATLKVPDSILPSEFVLRYDYKEKEGSNPYPEEQHVYVNKQNLELWVNPLHLHDTNNTHFQKGERENTVYAIFTKENTAQKEKLVLLQNFLLKYDDTKSELYT